MVCIPDQHKVTAIHTILYKIKCKQLSIKDLKLIIELVFNQNQVYFSSHCMTNLFNNIIGLQT